VTDTQLTYLVSLTLKSIENKNKKKLCTVLNGSICWFLYIKKILKKEFYILTHIWPTLFSSIAF
jgi:hypothetical protein